MDSDLAHSDGAYILGGFHPCVREKRNSHPLHPPCLIVREILGKVRYNLGSISPPVYQNVRGIR